MPRLSVLTARVNNALRVAHLYLLVFLGATGVEFQVVYADVIFHPVIRVVFGTNTLPRVSLHSPGMYVANARRPVTFRRSLGRGEGVGSLMYHVWIRASAVAEDHVAGAFRVAIVIRDVYAKASGTVSVRVLVRRVAYAPITSPIKLVNYRPVIRFCF